ncbi:hypothetical protein TL16_g07968 [Triparma laevis f. inornata]|uniref:Thioredoxin domain-containing protein n=2 Tax=Triparma laevis TaxID=1534972 RepID=A0A9W7E3T6_9STRA|nr:hypothetical protein TrLO_g242 [Triparma laevis f. longispina]GMH78895.1 hypothetical protein TL16_g07968 [Triparma laevis f. inornata]
MFRSTIKQLTRRSLTLRHFTSPPPSSNRSKIIALSGLVGLGYFAYSTAQLEDDSNPVSSLFGGFGKKKKMNVGKPLKRPPGIIALLPSASFLKQFTLKTPHPDLNTLTLLYFSAPWCPPCRHFTPVLKQFYEKVNSKGMNVEVLLIPCSGSENEEEGLNENKSYYEDYNMPWLRFNETDPNSMDHMNTLKKKHGVWAGPLDGNTFRGGEHRGIPTLILVNGRGEVVYDMARDDVERASAEGREMELIEGWRGACEAKK